MKTFYALLVGVNEYRGAVSQLQGCVNDVDSMRALLDHYVAGRDFEFVPEVLIDTAATRQRVIDGFREHLCQATEDDVALFYYSGHGSWESAPEELWSFEPDRKNRTLVCHDGREEGHFDLADKDLRQLVHEVGRRNAHVAVILDSCHSGSATRALGDATVRMHAMDARVRPLDSYLIAPHGVLPDTLPDSQHVLLAACQAHELASETNLDGLRRGVFTHHLLNAMRQHGGRLTYGDLVSRVNAHVRATTFGQSPRAEAYDGASLRARLLGGAITDRRAPLVVSFSRDDGNWVVNAGQVHGIEAQSEGRGARVALFPEDSGPSDVLDSSNAVGSACVVKSSGVRSIVRLSRDADHGLVFQAIVTATPRPPLPVLVNGDERANTELRAVLAGSITVGEVGSDPSLIVTAIDGGYEVRRVEEGHPLMPEPARSAQEAVRRLEHIARWLHVHNLVNPATRLPPDAVRMEMLDLNGDALHPDNGEYRFPCERRGDKWRSGRFRLRLRNTTRHTLHCMVLLLTEDYEISANVLPHALLGPDEEAWAFDGQPISAFVPKEFQRLGILESHDLLKLVVTADECPVDRFEQAALATVRDGTKSLAAKGVGRDPEDEFGADWTTSELTYVALRPRDEVELGPESNVLEDGVELAGHPGFRAKARLTSLPVAARGIAAPPLPALLADHPECVQPLSLTASRGGRPGLSVLELTDIEDPATVTHEQPLRLRIGQALTEHESVLPLVYDGEFYLPLGYSRGDTVLIEHLPDVAETKGVGRSLRIMLQKVVLPGLGGIFEYPLLTAIEADGGTVKRINDTGEIRHRVSEASRIVLFVHGILGDTDAMTESAFHPLGGAEPIADRYDLVLAFDYENLKTPIEETAADLGRRLAGVGLGSGHGKILHVVAHSMGGLVSRWFIEREGGNRVVERLVMLGTPNGGSNWATIQAWATTALGLALNGLTAVAWPIRAVGAALIAMERFDDTLDQMQPGSPVLQALAQTADPGVPYHILAGNTGMLAAETGKAGSRAGVFRRLLERLRPKRLVRGTASLAFWGKPNDLAVSVGSIRRVVGKRSPSPVSVEVACDHMTYFQTRVGQDLLREALK